MPRADPDALVDALSISAGLGVPYATLRTWARRYPDRLPRRGRDRAGRTLFRFGDACALAADRTTTRTQPSTPP